MKMKNKELKSVSKSNQTLIQINGNKKKERNQFDKSLVMQFHLFHESLELHVTIY